MEFQNQQPQQQMEEKPTLFYKLKRFVRECVRVLKVTKKPTQTEFKTIVKVSGIGILIIGLLGFVIQVVEQLIKKGGW